MLRGKGVKMTPETFSFEPSGGVITNAEQVKAQERMAWTPPKGHASWCDMNAHPSWRPRHLGSTAMARPQCGCGRNSLARSLRKLQAVTA